VLRGCVRVRSVWWQALRRARCAATAVHCVRW
jgi:hypothetical protein